MAGGRSASGWSTPLRQQRGPQRGREGGPEQECTPGWTEGLKPFAHPPHVAEDAGLRPQRSVPDHGA